MIAQGLHIGWQQRGWYIGWQQRKSSVYTRQHKQQQERAAHTLQVTAAVGWSYSRRRMESSQRKRQQERAYRPNKNTWVQTQGLSPSSSACVDFFLS